MVPLSNLGRWDKQYIGATEPHAYGANDTYRLAAEFTRDCAIVEDWGCGHAWLRRFVDEFGAGRYVGIDGSHSPFADVIADITTYRSATPPDAICLRGVLEHNDEWALVLDNAVASARRKLFITLFLPPQLQTSVSFREPDYDDAPVIGFRLEDLTDRIVPPFTSLDVEMLQVHDFDPSSPWADVFTETVIRCERSLTL